MTKDSEVNPRMATLETENANLRKRIKDIMDILTGEEKGDQE